MGSNIEPRSGLAQGGRELRDRPSRELYEGDALRRSGQSPRHLPPSLRPRERLQALGPAALSVVELLAILLGTGSRKESVTRTARRIARRHRPPALGGLGWSHWRQVEGLGPAAAARLCAAFELGRRAYGSGGGLESPPRVRGPQEAYQQVRALGQAKKEHLVGLYLDAQNRMIHKETISIGSLNTTRTHPREILYPAVAHLALGFILAHNHPSGVLEPSPEDVEFTHSVQRAGELMGIELYDHIIVTRRGYTSLRERGVF